MPKPNMNFEKNKHKFKDTWAKLIQYCKPYIPMIVVAVLLAIGGTIFTIIGPDKIKDMTTEIGNGLLGEMNISKITKLATTLVIFYSISVILSYVQGFIMATVTQRVSNKMRGDISKKINKLPLKYFDNTSYGDVLSRVTNDVDTIAQTLNQSIGSLVSAITLFFGSIIMMFVTNGILAITAIGASVIGFAIMIAITGKSQKYFMGQQKLLGDMNGHIEEVYSGHNVVKAYNAEKHLNKQFGIINDDLYKNAWKAQFISGIIMPLMSFIGNLGFVAVCAVGAVLTLKGHADIGVIVAFMIYVRLFTQPLTTFAQSVSSLQSTGAASFRVFEFLEEQELDDESQKSKILSNIKGDIEFKNVNFGYNPDKTIINDFSAKIKAGNKVAIVGPTGAGKTTMVNLLMRFYEINSGDILIDGTSIKDITRENVHDLFCMVLQDTWLFEGTIKENIVYNTQNVTDEQVEQACKAVGIYHYIMTLPKGFDTILNEDANISVGQRQLITIARAMISKAPMLILDEATSNVDTRTEILIQQAMDKLTENRTSIIIAHRLSTIRNADLILVMKDGDIIEKGNHTELLNQKGFYAELYNSQFENGVIEE